jgi:hypothetical protein
VRNFPIFFTYRYVFLEDDLGCLVLVLNNGYDPSAGVLESYSKIIGLANYILIHFPNNTKIFTTHQPTPNWALTEMIKIPQFYSLGRRKP